MKNMIVAFSYGGGDGGSLGDAGSSHGGGFRNGDCIEPMMV